MTTHFSPIGIPAGVLDEPTNDIFGRNGRRHIRDWFRSIKIAGCFYLHSI